MKKSFTILLIALIFSAIGNNAFSLVTTVPSGTGPYPTLAAALTAITAGGVYAGVNVTVTIGANELTTGIATLGPMTPATSYLSCTIKPSGAITLAGASAEAIIVLNHASKVTIDGLNTMGNSLTLNNTSTSQNAGSIRMSNGSSYNVVKNCTFQGVGVSTTSGGRTINIAQSALDAQGGNNYNIIEKNLVIGGRRGIQIFGTAPVGSQLGVTNNGTIIRNNIIKNASSIGIFVGSETRDNIVDSNEIFMETGSVSVGAGFNFRGINCQCVGINSIRKNRIHDLTSTNITATYNGIILIPVTLTAPGSSTTTISLVNNCITLMTPNDGFVEGITVASIGTQPYTGNIINNTVRLAGSAAATVGSLTNALNIANTVSGSTINVYNNIAINGRTGGIPDPVMTQHLGLNFKHYPATGVTLNSDYNLCKALDMTYGWDGGYDYNNYKGEAGLEYFKAATCAIPIEQNSVFKDLIFTGGINSCVLGLNGGDLNGKPFFGIQDDLFQTPRAEVYPYKGCYEGPALKILTLTVNLAFYNDKQIRVTLKTEGCVTVASCYGYYDAITKITELCYDGLVANGVGYYLYVSSNNSIQTSSAFSNIIFTSGLASYDFTTDPAKAFGRNQDGSVGNAYILAGDVNQDGIVDASDQSEVNIGFFNFLEGCRLNTDIDNNGIVDIQDVFWLYSSQQNFAQAVLPCPEQFSISEPIIAPWTPTYDLKASIYRYTNEIYIYIWLTNTSESEFKYAAGQYFFEFNPSIGNGGELTFVFVAHQTGHLNRLLRPVNPQILGNQLRLAGNKENSFASETIYANETKIVCGLRIITDAPTFANENLDLIWRNGPGPLNTNPVTKIFEQIDVGSTEITTPQTHSIVCEFGNCNATRNVYSTVLMEGMYSAISNKLSRKDTVTLYLRDADIPYSIRDSVKREIDSTSLSALFEFPVSIPNGQYYIVAKHRNCIETCSSSVFTFPGEAYYDFTPAANKAFGDNMKQVDSSPIRFAMYSGDVNQDGLIDISDVLLCYNDNVNFVSGYVKTDVTGDGLVDISDVIICYNNNVDFVEKITP